MGNITQQINQIEGVQESYWNGRNNTLSVYCNLNEMNSVKAKVFHWIDCKNLGRAIEKVNVIGA